MNHGHHVSRIFDEELSAVRHLVLDMGEQVGRQLHDALTAYTGGDVHTVPQIVSNDHAINERQKDLDEACANIVARRQPTGIDLRMILGASKIGVDLERAGDEAKKIAQFAQAIYQQNQHVSLPRKINLAGVGEKASALLQSAMASFDLLDSHVASEVIGRDTAIDSMLDAILRQLITHMMEDPRTISTALDIIWISRSVERVGDHAKNIAEHVIYIAQGMDIRYQKKS